MCFKKLFLYLLGSICFFLLFQSLIKLFFAPPIYKPIQNIKVVAFGDSITWGTGIKNENKKWTNLVKERLHIQLINSGVPGDTSSDGLARIKKDVLSHHPDYVIVNFGMNDHYMQNPNHAYVSVVNFKKNMLKIIKQIESTKAIPILVTPNKVIEGDSGNGDMEGKASYYYRRHPSKWYAEVGGANEQLKKYCDVLKEISVQKQLYLVDMFEESSHYDLYEFLISEKNHKLDDGVHPDEFGAEIYAQKIGNLLASLLKNTSKRVSRYF